MLTVCILTTSWSVLQHIGFEMKQTNIVSLSKFLHTALYASVQWRQAL